MLSYSNPPLLCLSVLLFLLHHSPVLSYDSPSYGNSNQCQQASFVPGHNLVGYGFNAVTLKRTGYVIDVTTYRKSDGSCNLYRNPLQGNKQQKVPLSVVEWRAFSQCNKQHEHNEHSSVSSLISHYSNEGHTGWQNGLNYFPHDLDHVGTRSHVYKFAADRTKQDYSTFSSDRVTCSHYSYRVSDKPPISREFYKALESLPSSYNSDTKAQYWRLIESFGTHYTSKVYLGGQLNRVTAARVCLSSLNGLSSQQVHYCLRLGFSLGLGYSTSDQIKSCNNFLRNQDVSTAYEYGLLNHHTEVIGGKGWSGDFSLVTEDSKSYKNWLNTLKDHPDVVEYSLRPLHELVSDWQQKTALQSAIQYYLKENAIDPWTQAGFGGLNLKQNCCPQKAFWGHLVVTITSGWVLRGGGKPEVYAVLKRNNDAHRTHGIRSNDPTWNARFDLGKVDTHQSWTVQVWASNKKSDNLLVSCAFYVHQGTHTKRCYNKKGKVEFKFALTCDHHLTGDKCNQYKPTPY